MIPNKTSYGFLTEKGVLARIATDDEEWFLTDDEASPPFLLDDPDQLGRILFKDTPHYNTQPTHPGWGGFQRADLTPVAVVLHVRAIEFSIPLGLEGEKIIDTRDLPFILARMYARGRELDQGRRFVGVLARGSAAEYAGMDGKHVAFGDLHCMRRVDWVGDVPDDYPTDLPAACLFICSTED